MRAVCWPTAQLEAAKRRYELLHQEKQFHDGTFSRWSKEASLKYPFHAFDGVSFWLSPVDLPDDDWLEQAKGLLAPDEDEQSSGE